MPVTGSSWMASSDGNRTLGSNPNPQAFLAPNTRNGVYERIMACSEQPFEPYCIVPNAEDTGSIRRSVTEVKNSPSGIVGATTEGQHLLGAIDVVLRNL